MFQIHYIYRLNYLVKGNQPGVYQRWAKLMELCIMSKLIDYLTTAFDIFVQFYNSAYYSQKIRMYRFPPWPK